jgi:hypothetical protein
MTAVQLQDRMRRWSLADRAGVAALSVAVALGTPGLGLETRHPANEAALSAIAFVVFALPLVVVALSFARPAAATRLGLATGVLFTVFGALDLVGVVIGPPPAGMVVVDAAMAVIGAAVAVRCWALAREAALRPTPR